MIALIHSDGFKICRGVTLLRNNLVIGFLFAGDAVCNVAVLNKSADKPHT